MRSQQSHHCGIETKSELSCRRGLGKQQSHHCGIETRIHLAHMVSQGGSNRTIVGLKQHLAGDFSGRKLQAAIAPLWD